MRTLSLICKFELLIINGRLTVVKFFVTLYRPNVITVSGLILVIISHCLVALYAPNFTEENVPPFFWILCALFLFAYYILDAMDGKQARKTGSSSPLGLIMDHGCDAMNACISSLTFAALLKLSPRDPSPFPYLSALLLALLQTSVPFFFATWEEYVRLYI